MSPSVMLTKPNQEQALNFTKPSALLWRARLIQIILFGLPLIVAATGAAIYFLSLFYGLVIAVVAALILVAAGIGLYLRTASWGYMEKSDGLVITRGAMIRRLTAVPFSRMQFVDVTAGPVERLLGIATVRLHTAAVASDVRIPGLSSDDASAMRDRLMTAVDERWGGL